MAGSKEIRTKIKSVENTRKITKAMEMVAASKMRKAQERMTRPSGAIHPLPAAWPLRCQCWPLSAVHACVSHLAWGGC